MQERKDANLVATAAYLLHSLVAVQDGTEGECEDGDEPVPEDQRDKVAEIAQQVGLDAAQLKDLLDDPNISIKKRGNCLLKQQRGSRERRFGSLFAALKIRVLEAAEA